jgi:hypothetical protein
VATGGDRVASPSHGREEGADERGPLAREREIARERGECGLTGGAEPTTKERREREGGGAADGRGRPVSGERRGAPEGAGPQTAQPGERRFFLFLFYFLFLISYFYFLFLFLLSPFILNK